MFWQTYKTTIKNLLRSGVFWFTLLIVTGIAVFEGLDTFGGGTLINSATGAMKSVTDKSPLFVLGYSTYLKRIINTIGGAIIYPIPLAVIVSTALVLNRDYGDNFYEIEKSSGIRPSAYMFGRVSALITINFIPAIIYTFVSFHTCIISRNGVRIMGLGYYVIDSTVRLMRVMIFVLFPAILFYIGTTLLLGCIFRSGLYSSVISVGYVVFFLASGTVLRGAIPAVYAEYLSPYPQKLMFYMYYYDTSNFEYTLKQHNTSFYEAAFCVLFLVGVAALFTAISYLFTRKRNR